MASLERGYVIPDFQTGALHLLRCELRCWKSKSAIARQIDEIKTLTNSRNTAALASGRY